MYCEGRGESVPSSAVTNTVIWDKLTPTCTPGEVGSLSSGTVLDEFPGRDDPEKAF